MRRVTLIGFMRASSAEPLFEKQIDLLDDSLDLDAQAQQQIACSHAVIVRSLAVACLSVVDATPR